MATHLQKGDKAPSFSGTDQWGNKISSAGLKGKKFVLYFYPEDDTPACTAQACSLRDNFSTLQKEGITVIGISPNEAASQAQFTKKYTLPFALLPDPKHEIINAYGVWGEKNLYGRKYMGLHRTSFLVDETGVIRKIWLRPKTKVHAEEILIS